MTDADNSTDAADATDATDATDSTDANDDADPTDDGDSADCTDATGSANSRKSRKRPARDPVERYLKSLRIGKFPGFTSMLGLMFIWLKLTGHIDWSWWWVLSPLLIKGSFMLLLIAGIVWALKKKGWNPSGDT